MPLTVLIQAGHQGGIRNGNLSSPGTGDPTTGATEVAWNIAVSTAAENWLTNHGVTVIHEDAWFDQHYYVDYAVFNHFDVPGSAGGPGYQNYQRDSFDTAGVLANYANFASLFRSTVQPLMDHQWYTRDNYTDYVPTTDQSYQSMSHYYGGGYVSATYGELIIEWGSISDVWLGQHLSDLGVWEAQAIYRSYYGTLPNDLPEINVSWGANNVPDGSTSASTANGTDFGSAAQGSAAVQHTFVIVNSGAGTLTLGTPTLPAGFTLVEGLSPTVAAGGSDTFTVQLNTTTAGTFGGQISFSTNDSDENPYNFQVAGTVTDTSPPPGAISISDVSLMEGTTGTQTAFFTVTRTGGTAAFSVNYTTADGTAFAGSDYLGTSGTLNFASNQTTATISVTVNGDTAVEGNETFFVNLFGQTNGATLSDSQGRGTILNDDIAMTAASLAVANFGQAQGWSNNNSYARLLADVDGDHKADIVGFGQAGTWVALATSGGGFGSASFGVANFGQAQGWSSDTGYHRVLADVNGDHKADIVGFGQAGTWVSLATAGGNFAPVTFGISDFGVAQGWSDDTTYHRDVADVNGDGMADIVGFGQAGIWVSLATGNGLFAPSRLEMANFSPGAGGWSSDNIYHRELADVNGDGMADIVGFGQGGVLVSLATGAGHFGSSMAAVGNFGQAQGWATQDSYPRHLADVNGDGRADIVGFGQNNVLVAFSTGDGHFTSEYAAAGNYTVGAGGWTSNNTLPRLVGDVTGDGHADIIGFGIAGTLSSLLLI